MLQGRVSGYRILLCKFLNIILYIIPYPLHNVKHCHARKLLPLASAVALPSTCQYVTYVR